MDLKEDTLNDLTHGGWKGGEPLIILRDEGDGTISGLANLLGKGQRIQLTLERERPVFPAVTSLLDLREGTRVLCASEGLLEHVLADWPVEQRHQVGRFVRIGDCQAAGSLGTADEQTMAEQFLDQLPSDIGTIAVVKVIGTDLLFAACNFSVTPDDIFSSKAKSVRPATEFVTRVIPHCVASFGLQRVICCDPQAWQLLSTGLGSNGYAQMLERAADPDSERLKRREALLAKVSDLPVVEPVRKGLFGQWLENLRAGDAAQPIGSGGPARRAIELFYKMESRSIGDDKALAAADELAPLLTEHGTDYVAATKAVCALRRGDANAYDQGAKLLQTLDPGHPTRDTLIQALTMRWASGREPSDWLKSLADHQLKYIIEAARQDDASYKFVFGELAASGDSGLSTLLPFANRELEIEQGDDARQARLDALKIREFQDPEMFYLCLELEFGREFGSLSIPVMEELLVHASERWGNQSADHRRLAYLVACETGDTALKIARAREWAELDEDEADAHCALGDALRADDRDEEAVLAYRKAIALDSKSADAWKGCALSLTWLGRKEEAKEAAETAYKLRQGASELFILGHCLWTFDDPSLFDFFATKTDGEFLEARLGDYYLATLATNADDARLRKRFEELSPRLDQTALASAVRWTAFELERAGKPEVGLDLLPSYVPDDEDFAAAAVSLGRLFEQAERHEKGSDFFRQRPTLAASSSTAIAQLRLKLYAKRANVAAARDFAKSAAAAEVAPYGTSFFGILFEVDPDRNEKFWKDQVEENWRDTPESVQEALLLSLVCNKSAVFDEAALANGALDKQPDQLFNEVIVELVRGNRDKANDAVARAVELLSNRPPAYRESRLREFLTDVALAGHSGRVPDLEGFLAERRNTS